jgi:SAM-dependent methyltransferase
MTAKQQAVFFEVHSGLPREGPGDTASTRRAFARLRDLPARPRVLDLGCGPGAQTLELARLCAGEIFAVDNHGPFVEHLRRRALAEGLGDRVHPVLADMRSLPFEPGSFDLVWAEGSIYLLGFSRGLTEWRALLNERGHVAVTEVSWLKEKVPAELAAFWQEAYPGILSIPESQTAVREAGYELLASFTLPESAWWDPYYRPIEAKLPALEARYAGDPEALEVLAAERQEIALFRKYSDWYGYVFYVAGVRAGHARA